MTVNSFDNPDSPPTMAFKNGLSERLDELRFPSPRSPPSDSPFSGYGAMSPGHASLIAAALSRPPSDVRGNLQRRFTTDSSKLTSWSPLKSGGGQLVPDAMDLLSSLEKKRQHIEYMREQRRRFEEDMKLLDLQHEREKQEMDQLARDLAKAGLSGPVSEPTTPPEYRDSGFPSAFSRPTRFSTSSVTSSPGFFGVFAPSQVTSPPPQRSSMAQESNRLSVHSVPGSRRNSDKEDTTPVITSPYRPSPSLHRYSMPSGGFSSQLRTSASGFNTTSVDSFAAAKYLFRDDDSKSVLKDDDRIPTPDIKSYLKMTDPDDKFPTLSRRGDSGLLSANSDALDLANSRTPVPEPWNTHSRHRSSHQSMPQNALNLLRLEQTPAQSTDRPGNVASQARHAARHSLEANLIYGQGVSRDEPSSVASSRPAPMHSSYSTNDVPTLHAGFAGALTPPHTRADQLPQHTASLGHLAANSASTRPTNGSPDRDQTPLQPTQTSQTTLHANAAPFGPQAPAAASPAGFVAMGNPALMNGPAPLNNFQGPFYGYGVQPYMPSAMPMNGQMQNYNAVNPFAYSAYNHQRFNEPPARVPPARRTADTDSAQASRFANFPLEHYRGELYSLCKDQHGCRYLQRKLEERSPEHVQMIFEETCTHVVELMTDPFGNYLCQKLLEYSNDEQRTALVNNAAPQLVAIALNQHGTRALQKMIEFISTTEQIETVIRSLRDHVVELVQDLNGNHVIQKCLNRLSAEDAQFIYDAVGTDCVIVGTHRHGCCVLQRCIDHASGEQRARLIAQITSNAFALVQDPFGNYVVQYILDLAEPHFTEPLCQAFRNNIAPLSKQKFSSNVIEKCLRTAGPQTRRQMIDEMLAGNELEKMVRDSFANYVVQTAIDFADADTRSRIFDGIRPILPSIRQTPHGRRIASKMMTSEGSGRGSAATSGQITPNEMNSAQLPGPMLAPQTALFHPKNVFPATPPSGTGSTVHTPSGAAIDSTRGMFSPVAQQSNGGPGAQNPLYTYF